MFTLILVFAADIGAYFGGRLFGRVKLAPQVSPGKTWEGVLGGIVFSGAWALGGSLWFQVSLAYLRAAVRWPRWPSRSSVTSPRACSSALPGLKDSGSLLPGHGGMMDRIDSITAAAPVLFFGLTSMGVVP